MSLLSPRANPTERRRVTLRYHGSKILGSQQEGASATTTATATRTAKKAIGLFWQNNNLCTSITLFCTFLSPASLNDSDMKRSYFTRPLYGVREHNTKCNFSFSELRYSPFGFNPKFRHYLTD